jgi:hypothetical protein
MRFGDATGQLDAAFNPFSESYLSEIIRAVAAAWAKIRPPKPNEIEDRITFRLAGNLMNDQEFTNLPYDIVPQHWLVDIDGRLLGRLDLRFKHRNSQREYFTFECKRLHVSYPGGSTSTEYRSYTGEAGLMAFIEQQYSPGFPAAGMLAYVMDGDNDKAWRGLEKRIFSQRDALCVLSALNPSDLTSALDACVSGTRLGETMHNLQTHILRVFHLLLPVRPAASRVVTVAERQGESQST